MIKEIKADDLSLEFEDLDYSAIEEKDEIVGQERALEALRLGFKIERNGYNIYVSGDESTARMSAVKREVSKIESDVSHLFDAAYAYNVKDPKCPISLIFKSMASSPYLVKGISLPKILDYQSDDYALVNWSLPTAQTGHIQSAGKSSKATSSCSLGSYS